MDPLEEVFDDRDVFVLDTEDEPTVEVDKEYPFEFRMTPQNPSYIFVCPDDASLCFRFRAKNRSDTSLLCVGCETAAVRLKRKSKEDHYVEQREFDGKFLETDPTLDHLPGCRCHLLPKVLKDYELFEIREPRKKFKGGFPLQEARKGKVTVIHRLDKDSSKCYKFAVGSRYYDGRYVTCTSCNEICKKNNIPRTKLRLHRTFMVHDPTEGHLEGCVPMSYYEETKWTNVMDNSAIDKLFDTVADREEGEDNEMDDTMNTEADDTIATPPTTIRRSLRKRVLTPTENMDMGLTPAKRMNLRRSKRLRWASPVASLQEYEAVVEEVDNGAPNFDQAPENDMMNEQPNEEPTMDNEINNAQEAQQEEQVPQAIPEPAAEVKIENPSNGNGEVKLEAAEVKQEVSDQEGPVRVRTIQSSAETFVMSVKPPAGSDGKLEMKIEGRMYTFEYKEEIGIKQKNIGWRRLPERFDINTLRWSMSRDIINIVADLK